MVIVKHCDVKNWTYGPINSQVGKFIEFQSGHVYIVPRCVVLKSSTVVLEHNYGIAVVYNGQVGDSVSYTFHSETEFRQYYRYVLERFLEVIGGDKIPLRRYSEILDTTLSKQSLDRSIDWYLTPFNSLEDACNTLRAMSDNRLKYDWSNSVTF